MEEQIARLGKKPPAIVLKIETRIGFDNLPQLLLAVIKILPCGLMIAHGDLAVECKFERLAEVQGEILWICEATHAPVIGATQVLESWLKKAYPQERKLLTRLWKTVRYA